MRAKPSFEAGACGPSALSDKRTGAIARASAILLSGTAAVALSMGQPANAIVINDQVAASVGGIANYFDQGNQYPYVVSLFSATSSGSQCTGTLINSRTILTAAHCFLPNAFGIPTISFSPASGPGVGITSFVRHPDFVPGDDPPVAGGRQPSVQDDIAVISLAQPVTNVTAAKLLTLQPGQPGFPTAGTTITMVGYGQQGTGSTQPSVACEGCKWVPAQPGNPPPDLQEAPDGRRRVATSSLGLYGVPFYFPGLTQPFFVSQFQDHFPNNPPNNNVQAFPATPLEGGTAGGDSGGPLFAMINGQMTQIGVVRGGGTTSREE